MNFKSILLFCLVLMPLQQNAQANDVLSEILKVSKDSSHVMNTVSVLSDVYGPRFLGTPNYYNSVLWLEKQLKSYGITKVKKHSFDKEHRGWALEGFSVEMSSPNYAHMNAYPLAFTESSDGEQEGEILVVSSFNDVYELKGELRNKILLLKGYYQKNHSLKDLPKSIFSEDVLNKARANPDPNDLIIGYHSRRSTVEVFDFRSRIKVARTEFFEFCKEEGVIAIIEPSNSPYGILHVDGNRSLPSFSKKNDIKPIASFVMSNEHFGRLLRLSEMGHTPKLKLHLKTKWYNNPEYNVNLIAEIEGTDPKLKHELVIIGAHLDSWHSGTGAVDNASNCAVIIEALRLLKISNVKPKRTIRIILWGGEEQVFAGSYAYVEDFVGSFETMKKKEEEKSISAYLNLDNGAGMIRGVYLMGNDKIEPYFAEYLQPFPKSQALTLQNANQTDHELFDFQNIPAFQFIQDPLDYINMIHHTNMDLYEYVPEYDQKYNSELVAYLLYKIAQEPELLPRKEFNTYTPNTSGNVKFEIKGHLDAKTITLVGDFNNWNMFGTPLQKGKDGWATYIDLPKGKYYYKFIIDGYWTADPNTPEKDLVKDGKGHGGLTILRVN